MAENSDIVYRQQRMLSNKDKAGHLDGSLLQKSKDPLIVNAPLQK